MIIAAACVYTKNGLLILGGSLHNQMELSTVLNRHRGRGLDCASSPHFPDFDEILVDPISV